MQGTILQEHWRVAFRRRYFTRRGSLQHSLGQFMRYYNRDRPHQGYRLRGRTECGGPRCSRCGIGSCRVPRPSLADSVRGPTATLAATVAAAC